MFTLQPLPFNKKDLGLYMSEETLSFHYNKHHQGYVDKLNKLIEGTELENKKLEEIIEKTRDKEDQIAIFNNAAQVFNHDFFWKSLSTEAGISSRIINLLAKSFGSIDNFKEQFKEAAVSQFGSGWAWLAQDGDRLVIAKTSNADTLAGSKLKPLLTIDVWEHAYYLDYQNRRVDFVENIIDNLLNWEFVEENLS